MRSVNARFRCSGSSGCSQENQHCLQINFDLEFNCHSTTTINRLLHILRSHRVEPSEYFVLLAIRRRSPLCELGWKSLGVLELTALPSIKEEQWVPLVQAADALLVGGGDPFYLCYWMRQSGLADLLPELGRETVYVGVSGGSMVVTAISREQYDLWGQNPPTDSDRALGLVDFTLYAHLDHPDMPDASLTNIEDGPPGYQYRLMRSTIRPPSLFSTEQSKLSPKAIGNGLRPKFQCCW